MTPEPKDDPASYPALGRALLWVDKPGSANKIFWALAALCLVVFLLDFTYDKYGHFDVEYYPGFYGFYGFVMFTGLILAAKALRVLIKSRHWDNAWEHYHSEHWRHPEPCWQEAA